LLASIPLVAFLMLLLSGCTVGSLISDPSTTPTPTREAKCNLATHICDKPKMTLDPTKDYVATIKTAKGYIIFSLDTKNSPLTVNNFVYLANQHYYDGTFFWRAEVPGKPGPFDPDGQPSLLSLIQGGSVQDDGDQDKDYPGYTIPDELTTAQNGYGQGIVAMATRGSADSGGAQFFINTGDNTNYFNPAYPVFGRVLFGLDIAKKVEPKDKIDSVTIAVSDVIVPTVTVVPSSS
jgi:cyclophilin family peptidyl-prolyl cis-trans isomerase